MPKPKFKLERNNLSLSDSSVKTVIRSIIGHNSADANLQPNDPQIDAGFTNVDTSEISNQFTNIDAPKASNELSSELTNELSSGVTQVNTNEISDESPLDITQASTDKVSNELSLEVTQVNTPDVRPLETDVSAYKYTYTSTSEETNNTRNEMGSPSPRESSLLSPDNGKINESTIRPKKNRAVEKGIQNNNKEESLPPPATSAMELIPEVTETGTQTTSEQPQSVKRIRRKLLSKVYSPQVEATSDKDIPESVKTLANWHTDSEQSVYEAMYPDTIARHRSERYFTYQFLTERTGILSAKTLKDAIKGLEQKKSIEVLQLKKGPQLGGKYRVFRPRDIMLRRKEAKIKIDDQTKKIL